MSQTVISVENLSKSYRLGQIGTGTLTNDLRVWWAKLRGQPNPLLKIGQADHGNRDGETLWALKDINLQVEQGEVLGIIGRNGAGKSTLLKILSRVTAPTSGLVKVKGRIASLLEVGTGFHPELTGRENIYLNGAILGMTRAEVSRKFDEIVAFAEIEQFIDTPVKRFSSGMYVRLAFAVAAHLEPEILLVDEVLAVGDAGFQQKCLGKMNEVAKLGRTVLFVSHQMAAIENLCNHVMLLDGGRIITISKTADVISQYLRLFNTGAGKIDLTADDVERKGTGEAKFQKAEILTLAGEMTSSVQAGTGLVVRMEILSHAQVNAEIGVGMFSSGGLRLTGFNSRDLNNFALDLLPGQRVVVECKIPKMNIAPGAYRLNLRMMNLHRQVIDSIDQALSFEVVPANYFGTGRMPRGNNLIFLDVDWHYQSQ